MNLIEEFKADLEKMGKLKDGKIVGEIYSPEALGLDLKIDLPEFLEMTDVNYYAKELEKVKPSEYNNVVRENIIEFYAQSAMDVLDFEEDGEYLYKVFTDGFFNVVEDYASKIYPKEKVQLLEEVYRAELKQTDLFDLFEVDFTNISTYQLNAEAPFIFKTREQFGKDEVVFAKKESLLNIHTYAVFKELERSGYIQTEPFNLTNIAIGLANFDNPENKSRFYFQKEMNGLNLSEVEISEEKGNEWVKIQYEKQLKDRIIIFPTTDTTPVLQGKLNHNLIKEIDKNIESKNTMKI